MKTDDLIGLLANQAEAVERAGPQRRAVLALLLGVAAAVVLTVAVLGPRANLTEELRWPSFWTREAFCAAMGSFGILAVCRLVFPGVALGRAPMLLALPVALMWLLAAIALFQAPPYDRAALIWGHTALVCPPLIAMVSAPVFVAVIWAMRRYAPTRLRLAGGAAGLAAGALGALVYTLHCPELAPPFLAIWYVLGMLIPAAIGAVLGPRLLRW